MQKGIRVQKTKVCSKKDKQHTKTIQQNAGCAKYRLTPTKHTPNYRAIKTVGDK